MYKGWADQSTAGGASKHISEAVVNSDIIKQLEDLCSEAGEDIVSSEENTHDDQNDNFDPIKEGCLVPDFKNKSGSQEDLFHIKWGSKCYISCYPTLERQQSDDKCIFTRSFIRQTVKELEPTLRQLYLGECQSDFPKHVKTLKKLGVHKCAPWPIELMDMEFKIQYFVMGLESDILKKPIMSFQHNVNVYVIWPEILTALIMKRYNMKYSEAINIFLSRLLPKD